MKLTSLSALPAKTVSHNPNIQKRVMLSSGDLPHLTQFAQAVFQPGQVAEAHVHADMHEVFFVSAGEGAIAIDGQTHRLFPGVCIAVAPGERHEVTNAGSGPLVLTYFGIIE